MRSYTLLELVITVAIVGILSTMGFINYTSYREAILDKEAVANLRLIIAAERIYRIEVGGYYAAANNQAINDNLRLLLPVAGTINWNYRTTVGGASSTCAEATRNSATPRSWRLRFTSSILSSGACP